MKVLFLDIDGVLALPGNYSTNRTRLQQKDENAKRLRIPYYWDARCVGVLNRFLHQTGAEIVVSSDWRTHWNIAELREIFAMNGVARLPIGYTIQGGKMSGSTRYNRVFEIQAWVEQNRVDDWVAIDDLDLSALGTRFVQTDDRMGIAQTGLVEKLVMALHPGALENC